MKKIVILACLAALLLAAFPLFAQKVKGGDTILGVWYNAEKDARIEVTNVKDKYFGKVIWLKEPNDKNGKPKTDVENPDAKLKSRPRMGLIVLTNLDYKGGNKYEKGKIYDPKSGKSYSAQVELVNANLIKLRGFIGVSLMGRTSEWTRYIEPKP